MAVRQARLSVTDRYRLRLLGGCNRHYVTGKGLSSLVALGLVAPTGRRNEAGPGGVDDH